MYAFLNRLLLPHAVFFAVLVAGWWLGELSYRQIAVFVGLWLVGVIPVAMLPYGVLWMTAFVAVLDIVLILKVFKADIRVG